MNYFKPIGKYYFSPKNKISWSDRRWQVILEISYKWALKKPRSSYWYHISTHTYELYKKCTFIHLLFSFSQLSYGIMAWVTFQMYTIQPGFGALEIGCFCCAWIFMWFCFCYCMVLFLITCLLLISKYHNFIPIYIIFASFNPLVIS